MTAGVIGKNPNSTTAQSTKVVVSPPSGLVVVCSINLQRVAHSVGVNSYFAKVFVIA